MATTLNTHIDQLRPPDPLNSDEWSWALVPLGLLLLVVSLHALNAMAAAYGRWTTSALTADSSVVRTQEEA